MAHTASVCIFGTPAPDFALLDTEGRLWRLSDVRGSRSTLIMFICNHCPYVQAVMDRILRDARDLTAAGVGVAAINANDAEAYPEDDFDAMVREARRHGFPFPYLHDADQSVARAFGAECTPEFFGYNADLQLQYRGRLDASGRNPAPAGARRELHEAMLQIARTGQGPREQMPAMGCSIKWKA